MPAPSSVENPRGSRFTFEEEPELPPSEEILEIEQNSGGEKVETLQVAEKFEEEPEDLGDSKKELGKEFAQIAVDMDKEPAQKETQQPAILKLDVEKSEPETVSESELKAIPEGVENNSEPENSEPIKKEPESLVEPTILPEASPTLATAEESVESVSVAAVPAENPIPIRVESPTQTVEVKERETGSVWENLGNKILGKWREYKLSEDKKEIANQTAWEIMQVAETASKESLTENISSQDVLKLVRSAFGKFDTRSMFSEEMKNVEERMGTGKGLSLSSVEELGDSEAEKDFYKSLSGLDDAMPSEASKLREFLADCAESLNSLEFIEKNSQSSPESEIKLAA